MRSVYLLPVPGILGISGMLGMLSLTLWNADLKLSERVPTLLVKKPSACCHTGAFFRSFNFNKDGNKASEKASLASLGSKLGKWSMLMTLMDGLS